MVATSKKSRATSLTFHFLIEDRKQSGGLRLEPPSSKALDLTPDSYIQCGRCFKKYTYPKDGHYETIQTDGAASSGSISSLSSGSETMDSVDTESDNEKTLGSALSQLVPLPCSSASS